jgi:metal-responsive CopG/Arc/MetJ family transcriptional regulator
MGEAARGERLQVMLTKQELEALDSWRFARRMPSRASAIRELLKRGLAAEGFMSAQAGSHSKDFGVMGQSGDRPAPRAEGRPGDEEA